MTDDLILGLGAFEPVPDDRDEDISALYAAEGVEPSAAIPSSFMAKSMPPVLFQGNTPQCVSFASAGMKAWQDRTDGPTNAWYDFDEARFHGWIGGTNAGAWVRDAMRVLKDRGYPAVRAESTAASHKIGSYYAIPANVTEMQQAILAFGPVVVAGRWAQSWMQSRSTGLVLPFDVAVGGHARLRWGWRTTSSGVQWRERNAWGSSWSDGGNLWMPAEYDRGNLWEAWKASDLPAPVYYRFGGRKLASPRTFVVRVSATGVRAKPYASSPVLVALHRGDTWTPRQVTFSGRGRWLGNRRGDRWVRIVDVRTAAASAVGDDEEV